MISQQQCQNATILIVDDQMTNIMLLESILQNAGYKHVHATQDPTQVVNLYKELNPDLICLDIRMPELNGFQIMGQLKIIHQHAYLPILVIVAIAAQYMAQMAFNAMKGTFLSFMSFWKKSSG